MKPLDFLGTPIQLSTNYGSQAPEHRERLRQALHSYVRDESRRLNLGVDPNALQALTNLDQPPRLSGWALSVSHCPVAGGFLAVPSDLPLGFDLEMTPRLSGPILERIAPTPLEKTLLRALTAGDARAYFWVAKEAAIKAYGNANPSARPHFGDVQITSIDSGAKIFRAEWRQIVVRGRLYKITEIDGTPLVAGVAQFDK